MLNHSYIVWISIHLHPGRLTWNLPIPHLERKMIFQKPPGNYVPVVNLQGCKSCIRICVVISSGWKSGWSNPDRWSPWWANCLIQRSHFRTRNLRPGQKTAGFFFHRFFCLFLNYMEYPWISETWWLSFFVFAYNITVYYENITVKSIW